MEAISEAIRQRKWEAAKQLIDSAALGVDLSAVNSSGETFLIEASREANLPVVLALLERGVDPDRVGSQNGRTALHWACLYGSLKTAIELLRAGASVDIRDGNGVLPLDLIFSPDDRQRLEDAIVNDYVLK